MTYLSPSLLNQPFPSWMGGAPSQAPSALPRPFASLASQVPVGVGRQAAQSALSLGGGGAASGELLSRLPSLGGLFTGGSAAARPMLGGLGFGIAGQVGSGLIDKLNPGGQNSNLEQTLQGAATGAGIGAGLGLLGGPLAPLTSGAGAVIGGVVGGGLGLLGNVLGLGGGGGEDDAPDPIEILGNGIEAAGLTPAQTEEILQTYEVMTALAESAPEGEERDALLKQAYDVAANMILTKMQEQETLASSGGGVDMMALQQQAADIFAPLAQSTEDTGRMYAAALGGIEGLPPEYAAIAQNTAARELSSSQKLANAYRAQAAVLPAINQLTQYQRDYQAMAAQMFQQATQQQMSPAAQDVSALPQGV